MTLASVYAGILWALPDLSLAGVSDEFQVQGIVSDFDQRSVSFEFDAGVTVIVPRETISAGQDVRPGSKVTSYATQDEMRVIQKKKSNGRKGY